MPKFAFVFPGQGSQAVGMLNGFADNAVVQETVSEASEALGFDLGKLIADGPKEELDLTTNTQPVLFIGHGLRQVVRFLKLLPVIALESFPLWSLPASFLSRMR